MSSIAGLVAVVVALPTLYFAWRTVREARGARQDATRDHSEAMKEQRRLVEFTREAHRAEVDEWHETREAERELEQLRWTGEIAAALMELLDAAIAEIDDPPRDYPGTVNIAITRIPALLRRLVILVAHARAVGAVVPAEVDKLAKGGYNARGDRPIRIVDEAVICLTVLGYAAEGAIISEAGDTPSQ